MAVPGDGNSNPYRTAGLSVRWYTYVSPFRSGGVTEHQRDVVTETEKSPNPVALSLVGGFVGTVTGLKRGGVPGAVVGGFVGGTAGYLSGASLGDGESTATTPGSDTEPISVGVSGDSGEGDDGDDAAE